MEQRSLRFSQSGVGGWVGEWQTRMSKVRANVDDRMVDCWSRTEPRFPAPHVWKSRGASGAAPAPFDRAPAGVGFGVFFGALPDKS